MTHLIIDAAKLDQWNRHHSGGFLIPADKRPTVMQSDRLRAEAEALRLARHYMGGMFVLFAPVAIAKRLPNATHVNLRGEVIRTENAVRLLTIAGGPEDSDIPF